MSVINEINILERNKTIKDRFKFRVWNKKVKKMYDVKSMSYIDGVIKRIEVQGDIGIAIFDEYGKHIDNCILMQCTGLKDKNGKLIYEGDIIVIPNQYPFYCYKNEKDKKQDLNETNGEIRGESILNYIGIVENIFNCWQYVYHCVNPARRGMNEGINNTLNDYGFDEDENSIYEVIGNIYENSELLNEVENDT